MQLCKLRRRIPISIFHCCVSGALFIIGYFIGSFQNSGLCHQNSSTAKASFANDDAHLIIEKHAALLIVVIFSAPSNFERRQIIRKTWLTRKESLSIKHFFAVGSASLDSHQKNVLQKEHTEYEDLLILDRVSDHYSKLSGKLQEILRWLDKYVDFTFLMKVDDDSFVRLDALYSELTKQPQEKLYWGFMTGDAEVKMKGKWKEPNWFLCDQYLPYALGGGYIITADLVHNVVLNSNHLTLYQNEDVALGAWLAPFDIKRLHDPRFDTEYMSRGCFNTYLVTHKQSTSMMITKYENIKRTGNLCYSEYRDRYSYQYNWNVPPSQCCIRKNNHIP